FLQIGMILLATSEAGKFGKNFYSLLAKEYAKDNIVSSPLGLEIALNMLYVGAGGKTGQELKKVLDAQELKVDASGKYSAFFEILKTKETVGLLDFANSIYVSDKIRVLPEFSKTVGESFNSQAVGVNLAKPDSAASIVNKWVKSKTHDRIPNAVTIKDMDASLKILLVNAFAFKGEWLFKFPSIRTRKETFHPAPGKGRPVKMMSKYGFYKAEELPKLDAKVLQLRYHKSTLSLYVFLPNKVDGLSKLEERLAEYDYAPLTSRQVHIKLPKFKIEFKAEISGILKQLGLVDTFGAANFTELVKESGIGVSKVIQNGVIEIMEKGSMSDSVPGIRESFVGNKGLPQAMVFKASHPFAYVVRDEKNIYFQGHFVNPQ
ncbi:hypothetical protein KR054_005408, partial [Drosophila jambulina]